MKHLNSWTWSRMWISWWMYSHHPNSDNKTSPFGTPITFWKKQPFIHYLDRKVSLLSLKDQNLHNVTLLYSASNPWSWMRVYVHVHTHMCTHTWSWPVRAIPACLEVSPNAVDDKTTLHLRLYIYIQWLSMLAVVRQQDYLECHMSIMGLYSMG